MKRTCFLSLFVLVFAASLSGQTASHPVLDQLPSSGDLEYWLHSPLARWGLGILMAIAGVGLVAFFGCTFPLCRLALKQMRDELPAGPRGAMPHRESMLGPHRERVVGLPFQLVDHASKAQEVDQGKHYRGGKSPLR